MSSILTNMSAMTALQNLAATQKSLATTQSQISSGLRVSNASDNAAYWSIATTMRGDTSALGAVSDALNLGSSVVGTATAAVDATLTLMYKLKADLVTAQTPGTLATQVQTDITAQQQSLGSILGSASFNGVNLLDGSTATTGANVVSSFTRAANGTTSVGYIKIDTSTAGTQLLGSTSSLLGSATAGVTTTGGTGTGTYAASSILGFTLTATTSTADMATMENAVDAAITSITATGAALGTAQTNINNQSTFVTSLTNAITSGVGSLVDADMNQASTRLNALQTQQQLGVQALSIANQNSQLILKLFQ